MTTVVEPPSMRDVVLVLLVVVFFGLAALYVRVVRFPPSVRRRGRGRGARVSADNLIGVVLAVAIAVYLVIALLFPERL